MSFTTSDLQWIVPVVGLLMTGAYYYLRVKNSKSGRGSPPPTNQIVINQTNTNAVGHALATGNGTADSLLPAAKPKAGLSILFVDDDVKFKVVSILKSHGWTNTRIVKDVTSLEQPEVVSADIFFVDIQGVGKALQFRDEGLGLVTALKRKYPQKKVVIYSAETGLNPFHAAFKAADDQISKDADPYEFIDCVERLTA